MTSSELQSRFKQFAYRVVSVCEQLPPQKISSVIEHQVLRSSFSAAANYRAACKGISRKAFIAKLSIAFEEIDESLFWLECILDLKLHPVKKMEAIIREASELASILASARKTSQLQNNIKS